MNQVQKRSSFVDVVAWVFIVLSGFVTLIAIMQNIMLFAMFSSPEISQAMQAPSPPDMPPVAAFITRFIHLFFLGFLIVSAFTLVSAIGLLKRWNWARMCFIGIMLLAIAWNLGGLVLQFWMYSSMQGQLTAADMQGAPNMQTIFIAFAVVGALVAVGFSTLFGWIAKRLLSPGIVAEFQR